MSPAAPALLDAHPTPWSAISPTPSCVGSREHAHFLDALVPTALAAGVSHLCTLDVDSFPIRDDWLDVVSRDDPADGRLAGVCRLRTATPRCRTRRASWPAATSSSLTPPSFSPDTDGTPGFREFRRTTGQRADTGIRLGARLWPTGEPWGRLLRTNVA